MESLPIRDYMSPLPQTIEVELSLAVVQERMRDLEARHLPVLQGATLVGVISAHDVERAQALGLDLSRVAAGVAMTPGPYVVGPETPLPAVARTMAQRKVGCALVMQNDRVVGIVTTTDALELLADFVSGVAAAHQTLPSATRQRIAHEHSVLRSMITRVEETAERVLREDEEAEEELPLLTAELYQTLLRHIDVEDTLLVPVLREIPTSGPIRAQTLLQHHREQRAQIQMAMTQLGGDPEHLANSLRSLAEALRLDLKEEEDQLITTALLKDDPVQVDAAGG